MTEPIDDQPVKKKPRGKPFEPNDPRCNRNGRPRSFNKLREAVKKIGHEIDKASGQTLLYNMVRQMYIDGDSADRKTLLKYGYGEPIAEMEVTLSWRDQAAAAGFDPAEIERAAREAAEKYAKRKDQSEV